MYNIQYDTLYMYIYNVAFISYYYSCIVFAIVYTQCTCNYDTFIVWYTVNYV